MKFISLRRRVIFFLLTGRRHGDRRFTKWTRFFVKASWLNIRRKCSKACGAGTQERYAQERSAECYLRVFLSFNLQYLRYERRRVVKFGVFLYLSCITHAQLSKAANRIECEIGCVVWSSQWLWWKFFSRRSFFYWDWHFEGCKNVGVRRICECQKHITLLWMWLLWKLRFV